MRRVVAVGAAVLAVAAAVVGLASARSGATHEGAQQASQASQPSQSSQPSGRADVRTIPLRAADWRRRLICPSGRKSGGIADYAAPVPGKLLGDPTPARALARVQSEALNGLQSEASRPLHAATRQVRQEDGGAVWRSRLFNDVGEPIADVAVRRAADGSYIHAGVTFCSP